MVSCNDVNSTNFVPGGYRVSILGSPMGGDLRTCHCEMNSHLESLPLDNVSARARSIRGEPARNGVNTVQRSCQYQLLIGSKLRHAVCHRFELAGTQSLA